MIDVGWAAPLIAGFVIVSMIGWLFGVLYWGILIDLYNDWKDRHENHTQ